MFRFAVLVTLPILLAGGGTSLTNSALVKNNVGAAAPSAPVVAGDARDRAIAGTAATCAVPVQTTAGAVRALRKPTGQGVPC